jgi:F0F1-type ATP synthase delta subunit
MKEIKIIGKAISSHQIFSSRSKYVTTAEFVDLIDLVIDSFQTKIIPNTQNIINIQDDINYIEIANNILTEANDMIKELERIKRIAIKYS